MRRVLLVVLAATVALTLTGSPAQAQTKTRRDTRGEVGTTWDIRSAKVQNNAHRYALTVRIADVQRKRTSVTTAILPGSVERAGRDDTIRYFNLHTLATGRGRWSTSLDLFTQDGTGPDAELVSDDPVACSGLRTTVRPGRRGFVRVVVPQRCFGDLAGRLVTSVSTYDSIVTREADGMRVRPALRGDVPDDELFDVLSDVTTRRGR